MSIYEISAMAFGPVAWIWHLLSGHGCAGADRLMPTSIDNSLIRTQFTTFFLLTSYLHSIDDFFFQCRCFARRHRRHRAKHIRVDVDGNGSRGSASESVPRGGPRRWQTVRRTTLS